MIKLKKKKKKIGDSNNEIISNNLDIASTFNEYFQNPITNPGITEYSDNFGRNTATLRDPVNIVLGKFKDYPSVRIMRVNVSTESLFHFTEISMPKMTK